MKSLMSFVIVIYWLNGSVEIYRNYRETVATYARKNLKKGEHLLLFFRYSENKMLLVGKVARYICLVKKNIFFSHNYTPPLISANIC
jgi:hypothetical protein